MKKERIFNHTNLLYALSNQTQKVVYILPFYDENTDTHFFYNYELIKRAARLVDIFLIIEKQGDKPNLGTKYYEQKFRFLPFRFLELLFKCFALRISGYKNFYVHYSYYGAIAAWMISILWRFNLRREVEPPRVFYWNRGMPWLFKRGWFEEKVFRFILRHTILVTGPESLAQEYVKRYGVKRYRVLSNWVDVGRFAPKPKLQNPNSKIILFVHHLSKRKGADLIPKIAKGFAGEGVEFWMIGDGPEIEAIKSQITNYKLQTNLKPLGKIPNTEIPKYLHVADIFIMPSREEGSPHVLLEAMASGTPFVASDVGGVREIVPPSLEQFLCESEDVKCFQEKIKMLLSDKMLYDKARAECLARAQNFDITRGVREFIKLFGE